MNETSEEPYERQETVPCRYCSTATSMIGRSCDTCFDLRTAIKYAPLALIEQMLLLKKTGML